MIPGSTDLATRLEILAERVAEADGPVVLVSDDLQVHADALADLADDPRGTTAALVSRAAPAGDRRGGSAVRLRGGRVVSASSGAHRVHSADAVFTGALRVAPRDRAVTAAAARTAAELARSSGWAGDPVDYLLVALVRGGASVAAVSLDPWPWGRDGGPTDSDRLARELAAIGPAESHRLRLARATKSDDGAVATLVNRPLSRLLTPWALRWALTPNQVTLASVVIGLGAAACFATGGGAALVAGAVLLQLSLVVDCVDGDVARYTRSFSATGAWLDSSTDRLKEFACYGGLVLGSDAGPRAWLLAAAMLSVQAARHSIDYTFTAAKDLREIAPGALPLAQPDDDAPADGSASTRAADAVRASERSNRSPVVKWTKRALHMSIGERWMVLAVVAALGRPLLALGVLLVLALVSLAYTSAGRTLRARSWPRSAPSEREREIVVAQADAGPLPDRVAGLLGSVRPGGGGRFLWVRPALLRLAEYAAVVAVVAATEQDALPAAFALLLVVAWHHYDQLYRVLNRLSPPSRAARVLGLGVAGRVCGVVLLALAGGAVLEGGLWVAAAVLGILYLVVEPLRVLREVRSVRPGDGVPAGGDGG